MLNCFRFLPLLFVILVFCCVSPAFAQKKPKTTKNTSAKVAPDPLASLQECKAHIQFLASDNLKGRMTGEPGNNQAADYIADTFHSFGLKPAPGLKTYMQPIEFRRTSPPSSLTMVLGKDTLPMGTHALMFSGSALNLSSNVVFASFGMVDSAQQRDDYAGLDVRGKVVVVKFGASDSTRPQEGLNFSRRKREFAEARGAQALIELVNIPVAPLWARLNEFNKRLLLQIADSKAQSFPFFFIKDIDKRLTTALEQSQTANTPMPVFIATSGMKMEPVFSQNVIGVLPGTDPVLSKEYVILSAHYDHIGSVSGTGQQDSIYNGARDNAMGTTAILAAARAFGKKPAARSLLFIAFTGEEMGLLGSRYYADNPVIPLHQAVYNLNCDGAGFNDTSAVTIIGLERTTARPLLEQAAQTYGLRAVPDPAPEQNLFDRSDNVSFAAKGIPAPTFSPGLKAFDGEIMKYYHQLADEAGEDFDFAYLARYANTYITAVRLIANAPARPRWADGDKYEAAFKALYSSK